MWVKRFPYEALVGCKTGLQSTWLLKCTKGVWEGQVGICSTVAASAPVLVQPKSKGICKYPKTRRSNNNQTALVLSQLYQINLLTCCI